MRRIDQVDLYIDADESRFIQSCIENRWLTEGPRAEELAARLAEFFRTHCVTFAPNGTLGLFLCLKVLDLPPDSEIIIPSFTFYASASAAVFAGLRPVYIDVDPQTFNMDVGQLEQAITPRTRAIMPVHIYGQACDMDPVLEIARRHGLAVVEDAAQAFGVTYKGRPAGALGDIGIISLFSDKVITSGEGCIVLCAERYFDKLRLMRNQGRTSSGTYVHPELGMNFRITDLQAAIALSQVAKFSQIVGRRRVLRQRYREALEGVGDLSFMSVPDWSSLVPFRFPILSSQRTALGQHLEGQGIQTRSFFCPLHLQPKLRQDPPLSLPVSERLYEEGLCLPIHWHISDEDADYICASIGAFFAGP